MLNAPNSSATVSARAPNPRTSTAAPVVNLFTPDSQCSLDEGWLPEPARDPEARFRRPQMLPAPGVADFGT